MSSSSSATNHSKGKDISEYKGAAKVKGVAAKGVVKGVAAKGVVKARRVHCGRRSSVPRWMRPFRFSGTAKKQGV